MTPDYRPSSRGGFPGESDSRPAAQENTLKTAQVQIERKAFIFSLRQNPRGRFLRITEDVGGRHDNIIIPATGLEEFRRVLDEMIKASVESESKARQP